MHNQRTPKKPSLPKTQRLLLVSLARNIFALPIKALLHRSAKSTLLAAPDLPPIFVGFLRDPDAERLVPVVQPRSLFQLPVIAPHPSKEEALLVRISLAKGQDKTIALLVDELLGQYQEAVSAMLPAYGSQQYLLTCISHTVEIDGDSYPVIGPEGLLEEIEEHCQSFLGAARRQQNLQKVFKPRGL